MFTDRWSLRFPFPVTWLRDQVLEPQTPSMTPPTTTSSVTVIVVTVTINTIATTVAIILLLF